MGGFSIVMLVPRGCKFRDTMSVGFSGAPNNRTPWAYGTVDGRNPASVELGIFEIPFSLTGVLIAPSNRWFGLGISEPSKSMGKIRGSPCPSVDGGNPAPVEAASLSHYVQGFLSHPRWLFGISSINSWESLESP